MVLTYMRVSFPDPDISSWIRGGVSCLDPDPNCLKFSFGSGLCNWCLDSGIGSRIRAVASPDPVSALSVSWFSDPGPGPGVWDASDPRIRIRARSSCGMGYSDFLLVYFAKFVRLCHGSQSVKKVVDILCSKL